MASSFLSLFPAERISFSLDHGSKEKVIESLLGLAVQDLGLDESRTQALLDALLVRENSGSTGVGGVSIPHVKNDAVDRTVAALGVFTEGVDFQAVDGELVHAVFLLASPGDQAQEHVQMLRWIAGLVRKQDFLRFLRQTHGPAEVVSLLQEMSS